MLRTASVSPLDRDKDTVLDPRKMLTHFSVIRIFPATSIVISMKQEPLRENAKGVKSLGKERSARGEEPLFKAVCSSRIFYKKRFVLCTTSVSPLDCDKDIVLDPRKMLTHFSAIRNSPIMPFVTFSLQGIRFIMLFSSRKASSMQKRAPTMNPGASSRQLTIVCCSKDVFSSASISFIAAAMLSPSSAL